MLILLCFSPILRCLEFLFAVKIFERVLRVVLMWFERSCFYRVIGEREGNLSQYVAVFDRFYSL